MKPILFPAGQTSFQSEPTVAQLRSAAESYIRNNDVGSPKVSLDFSFVVRKEWDQPDTQIGAFTLYRNAVLCVDLAEEKYFVFDQEGNRLYPEAGEQE